MCNPRRVRVTATRQLEEAWHREVSRTVSLRGSVVGEARVRQRLDATLGDPALRALDEALAADDSGWTEVDRGYRREVEGGYVLYLADDQVLEIVATLEDEVQASGDVTRELHGRVSEELFAEGEGTYYSDNWGGHTKETARKAAQKEAAQKLDASARERIKKDQEAAETAASDSIEAEASAQAQEKLEREATSRREELAEEARQHLDTVGLRCRQEFYRVLARAYSNAILTYAETHGAENIQCNEGEDVVEIEFNVQR